MLRRNKMDRNAEQVRPIIDLEEVQALLRSYEGPGEPVPRSRAARRSLRPVAFVGGVAAVAALAAGIFAVIDRSVSGPASTNHVESAQCAATVVWHGVTYSGSRTNAALAVGDRLADVRLPVCVDHTINGKPVGGPAGATVSLVQIQGVDSSIAVAVAGDNRTAYLAAGYFPQQRAFPLHSHFYGTPDDPNELDATCVPGKSYRIRGTVLSADFGYLRVKVGTGAGVDNAAGRIFGVLPDVHTRIESGLGSPPHVDPGASLGIAVRECLLPDGANNPKLVATEIEP